MIHAAHNRNNPDAYPGSAWADTPLARRLQWVRAFRARLFDATDELVTLMAEEVGKPKHEALTGDLLPLLAACKWHERHAKRILKPAKPRGTPIWMFGQRHRLISVPLGHVAIIATWNYPVQLLGIQMLQALVAGNRVTVKPSERSPRTQTRLIELAAQGLPDGTLTRYDAGREAGAQMLANGHFDHVVFTGSTPVGRSIAATLAQSLTPSTLELSGRDSVLVLDDADPDLAAERIWNLVTMNAGQTCMAPRRVLVATGIYDRVCDALRSRAPQHPRNMIDDAAAEQVRTLANQATADDAQPVPAHTEQHGRAVMPSMILHAHPQSSVVAGDHFGPLSAVVRCDNEDEMIRLHHECSQHLATSVFTARRDRALALAPRLGAATVVHNDIVLPTAHPGVSIQGHADSGWGASRGEDGLRAMSRRVHFASVPRFLRAPAGEPGKKQLDQLRTAIRWIYGRGPRS
jgi:aldehyde dehydrogenase (NAD+)